MKRAAAIGSCLSNLTVAAGLERNFGFQRSYFAAHNRSDSLLRYHIEKSSPLPPRELVDALVVYHEDPADAQRLIDNQYPGWIGYQELWPLKTAGRPDVITALETETFDVILLDNFMDLVARLAYMKSAPDLLTSPLFIVPHLFKNHHELSASLTFDELLTPDASAKNFAKIFRWLRKVQPDAHLAFLGFASSQAFADQARHRRSWALFEATRDLLRNQDILIIPPRAPPPEFGNGEADWQHFKDGVYQALGGYVWLNFYAGPATPDSKPHENQ